jgi:hypothetical protein
MLNKAQLGATLETKKTPALQQGGRFSIGFV